jgi:hypothetical protein
MVIFHSYVSLPEGKYYAINDPTRLGHCRIFCSHLLRDSGLVCQDVEMTVYPLEQDPCVAELIVASETSNCGW